tara:strand:- start:871 stop:1782 length:912 start_codon:yes stop_codon:yes gene_type:complete
MMELRGRVLLWHNCHDGSGDDPFGRAAWWRADDGPDVLFDRAMTLYEALGDRAVHIINQPAGKLPRSSGHIVSAAHVWSMPRERRLALMRVMSSLAGNDVPLGAYIGLRVWSHLDVRTPRNHAMSLPSRRPDVFLPTVASLAAAGAGVIFFDLASNTSSDRDPVGTTANDVRHDLIGYVSTELSQLGCVAGGEAIPHDNGELAFASAHAPWLASAEHLDRQSDPDRSWRAEGRTLFVHFRSGDADPRETPERPYTEDDVADFVDRGFGISIGLTRTGVVPAKFRDIVTRLTTDAMRSEEAAAA